MKRAISVLIFSLMVICAGCYNDDDDYVPDIKAHTFHETIDKPGIKIPDIGTKVFYYYKVCLEASTGYTYNGEGLLRNIQTSQMNYTN